ncbi:unnamed protein product [Paramecium sonneborni]|uniref:Uncharacterized protein n=1 Tax=Paramecium sonneborni TaxID=65129 RepID=A0A8S1LKS9_9CILI|nr:unnamed protein product [Paramecium sonneborni]
MSNLNILFYLIVIRIKQTKGSKLQKLKSIQTLGEKSRDQNQKRFADILSEKNKYTRVKIIFSK